MQISHFLKKPDFQLLYINTFASKSSTNITLKQFPHNSEIKADDATLKEKRLFLIENFDRRLFSTINARGVHQTAPTA